MVRRGLTGLTADGVGITGGLPSCLFANGSHLTELHLGEACPAPASCQKALLLHAAWSGEDVTLPCVAWHPWGAAATPSLARSSCWVNKFLRA